MNGLRLRWGVRLKNYGVKFRVAWLIKLGDKIRESGLGEYV